MGFQEIIVLMIVAGAIAFVGRMAYSKSRAFSPKTSCGNDCGCSTDSNKTPTSI